VEIIAINTTRLLVLVFPFIVLYLAMERVILKESKFKISETSHKLVGWLVSVAILLIIYILWHYGFIFQELPESFLKFDSNYFTAWVINIHTWVWLVLALFLSSTGAKMLRDLILGQKPKRKTRKSKKDVKIIAEYIGLAILWIIVFLSMTFILRLVTSVVIDLVVNPVTTSLILYFQPYSLNTTLVTETPLVQSGDQLPVIIMNRWIADAWIQDIDPIFEEENCADYVLDIREKSLAYETLDVDQFIVRSKTKKMIVFMIENVTEPCHLSALRIVSDMPIRKFYSNYGYYAGFRRFGKMWETMFYLTEQTT
jgi:hypothetical protein